MTYRNTPAVRLAFQGVPGAYSHEAIGNWFAGTDYDTIGFKSFEDAFQAVKDEVVDAAVIPIENSQGGSIHVNYDLILSHGVHIAGEFYFQVRHNLLVPKKKKKKKKKKSTLR
eukprot:Trichotokara_eunicae@DN7566_c0_g1_i1.p1